MFLCRPFRAGWYTSPRVNPGLCFHAPSGRRDNVKQISSVAAQLKFLRLLCGLNDSSPAIYRWVRYYMGLRPGGTPEYRRSRVKAEGPPLLEKAANAKERLYLYALARFSGDLQGAEKHNTEAKPSVSMLSGPFGARHFVPGSASRDGLPT